MNDVMSQLSSSGCSCSSNTVASPQCVCGGGPQQRPGGAEHQLQQQEQFTGDDAAAAATPLTASPGPRTSAGAAVPRGALERTPDHPG